MIIKHNEDLLGAAIIGRCCQDYALALIRDNEYTKETIEECREFLESEWCAALAGCHINVSYFERLIKEQATDYGRPKLTITLGCENEGTVVHNHHCHI